MDKYWIEKISQHFFTFLSEKFNFFVDSGILKNFKKFILFLRVTNFNDFHFIILPVIILFLSMSKLEIGGNLKFKNQFLM